MKSDNTELTVPETLRNMVVLTRDPDTPDVTLACISAADSARPEIHAYLATLLNRPGVSVRLNEMSPADFESLKKDNGNHALAAHTPLSQQASEVQLRVINMMREAQQVRASDLHIDVRRKHTVLQVRVYGLLWKLNPLSRADGVSMLSTTFQTMCDVMSHNHFKDYQPQDARMKKEFLGAANLFGARYAHINTPQGVFAVLRLIPDDGSAPPSPEALGFLPQQIALIHEMLERPNGIIINSGPVGSGKSTSGRSFMHYWQQVTHHQLRIITQEDPVEGEVDGVIHSSVTGDRASEDDIETAWLRGRRAMLRLDPDMVYIGEIRDYDSAMASINFAEAGRLVLTTQHANSPLGNLNRLQIIGIPAGWLRSSRLFTGLIAQRLLPTLCPHCARRQEEAGLTREQTDFIGHWFSAEEQRQLRFRNPDGCPKCILNVLGIAIGHGLKGRTVAAEVMRPTPDILRAYHEQGEDAARQLWLTQGGITLSQHARIRVLEGRVDPLIAHNITPFDDTEGSGDLYGN